MEVLNVCSMQNDGSTAIYRDRAFLGGETKTIIERSPFCISSSFRKQSSLPLHVQRDVFYESE